MKTILTKKREEIQVSDEDYTIFKNFPWHRNAKGYVVTSSWDKQLKKNVILYMHRVILGFPKGLICDHENRNKLNNQRYNLRILKSGESSRNTSSHRDSTSKYKGVSFRKDTGKWTAQICKDGKRWRYSYVLEKDAALAYNQKAKELFGEFAVLNQV